MRTTILAVLMLTTATGADAQGKRELEFGGGFHFWNLMQHYHFSDFPTGPTVDLTWVRWGERLPVYGHATLRYQFKPDAEGNVWSLGVGTPWALFWERNHPRVWDAEGGYWTTDRRPEAVEGEFAVGTLLVHTEVLVARQVSEKLKLRAGVRVAPFIYPLMVQLVVLGVWGL